MSTRFAIWLLCAGAVAIACGPHARHNETAASTTSDRPAPAAAEVAKPLAASANVRIDHGVRLTLHVTNVSDHSLEIDFPTGQTHDFVIVDSTGREVWRWSKGRLFTQALQNRLLGANETATYDARWKPRGRRGRFTALAVLKSNNHPIEQRVDFTLP